MFLDSWNTLLEIVLLAILVYAALVTLLRMVGKRITSKMNNFDWVVTVALGSMVSMVILNEEVSLIAGVVGITALVLCQLGVTFLATRFDKVENVVKATPRLLFFRGQFDEEALRQERVTENEVLAAVRQQGYVSLEEVLAIVLETNANLSVLPRPDDGESLPEQTTFRNVEGLPE